MTVLRAFWTAAATVDAAGAARFDQARTHPYSTPAALRLLWEAADPADIHTGELTASSEYEDPEECWPPMLMPDGAPGRFLATLGPAARRRRARAAFERLGRPSGAFELAARGTSKAASWGSGARRDDRRRKLELAGALLTEARLLGPRQERPSRRTSRFSTAMRRGVAGVGRQGSRVL
jgi:hypothetical protein